MLALSLLAAPLPAVLFLASVAPAAAQVNVTTYHNDIGRTGQNLNETILTTSNVNPTTFGKLFSQAVDGQIYAQPLYMSGVTIANVTHNVVYVATENDSVYAFDADSNSGSNASPLWKASMLSTTHGAAAGATTISSNTLGYDIQPQIGITGTPVIDPSTNTLYVVSKSLEGGNAVQRLHALDITSGAEKFQGPVVITASVPGTGNGSVNGTLTFDSLWENQRPGLLLLNGVVYVGFAAHGDNGPWHGWILGYNAGTLTQTGVYCASPNGTGSGFWMSGEGLAADQLDLANHPYGRMFVPTGNGDYNATKPYTNAMDYGDTHLNLDLTNGVPTVTDEFTTNQQATLDAEDGDIGSGGMVVLPTQTTGSYPHLAVQADKSGTIYLINRDNMGGYNTSADQIVQELTFQVGSSGFWGEWATPAYWNGNVYYWGRVDNLKSFSLTNGLLSTKPTAKSSETYQYPGATPSISANGASQGIVWSIDTENYTSNGAALLQAHSASNVATTLYSSSSVPSRDTPGGAVKFAVPTVVNGKVYVGAAAEVDVYGLLNSTGQTSLPSFSPTAESYTGTLSVAISDASPNAVIYYTLDGSTPTTSSTVYSAPISVTTTETITAIAVSPGLTASPAYAQTYTNTAQVPAVTFSLPTGTYTSAITVSLSDVAAGTTIYYTTDGTTPTTSSAVYSSAIPVSATETITAFAAIPGASSSPILAETFTIQSGASGISFPEGFSASAGLLILNGSTGLNDSRLQLTNGLTNEAGTAWYLTPLNISSFTTDFTFQLSNPNGEGITFALQNSPQTTAAVGTNGAGLGYQGITNSVAIKFDLYSDSGEGADSIGLYVNGAIPTVPSIDLTSSGINLHSDDEMGIHLVYNGTVLTMTITDMVTAATYTTSWTINIPSTIGSSTAYIGFTGGTSTQTASQKILTWTFTAATTPTAATPTFSPAGGTYTSPQSVTISDATSGSSIYYTTNGNTPTTSSTLYSGAIAVNASETLQAIAVASGYQNSAVASAAYTINLPTAATPTFSPAAGTYASAQSVTISDTTSGASIYYTTNGNTPTTSSTLYSGAITVNASETLKAIAVASNYLNSAVASGAYTITLPTVATPTFSPAAGTYPSAQSVTISDTTSGASIYYTTNGTTPSTSSTLYSGAISVTATETLKAIAVATNYQNSAVASAAYTISPLAATPTFSVAGGTYSSSQSVTISDTTTGAKIYYTLTGTPPTTSSTLYTGAITVNASETIEAIAVATNYSNSAVAVATYTIGSVTAPPVFSVPGGTYQAAQSVTITDATPGAVIYYTTDQSTPTTSSTKYTAAVNVAGPMYLQAIAVAPGFTTSAITAANYNLVAPPPVFSLAAGTYTTPQTLTITDSSTTNTYIVYTTNGSTPTSSSPTYTGPLTISSSETVQAFAIKAGFNFSSITSAAYVIAPLAATPTFSVAAGTYATTQSVTLSDTTPGSTIYYTTNGGTPTPSSSIYSSAIQVSASETLKAIAVASGYQNSAVASAAYVITLPAATPTFSVAAGTYSSVQSVTISDTTPGATIYYTTNGGTPSPSSSIYSSPIQVSSSETLKAIAAASSYSNSAVASAAYVINLPAATPTFNVAAGTYLNPQSVTISDATSGATIYYTTDGSTPSSTNGSTYSGPVSVSLSETLSAVAIATGYSYSPTAAAAYVITSTTPTPTPVFSQPGGAYDADPSVLITDSASSAVIYYTKSPSGTTPTTASTRYYAGTAIAIPQPQTLEAIAIAPGYAQSAVATAAYTLYTDAPVITPAAGTYSGPVTVTITDTSPNTKIYYTLNGGTPTFNPAVSTLYTGPFTISSTATLKVIAGYSNATPSAIQAITYNIP